MKTVIMAGGKGTRIRELFPDIPKPLIPISDGIISKPVLEWEIESLREQGFTDIIITVSYLADKIMDYFKDGTDWGVHIEYYIEEKPLGNAGALLKIKNKLTDDFLLLIADAMYNVDFRRMLLFHKKHNAWATLFSHPNSHPFDSSLLISNGDNEVVRWINKEDARTDFYKNRVNAGIQILNIKALERFVENSGIDEYNDSRIDLDRHILKPLCGMGKMFCYDSPEYCKDMGTPERYYQVNEDFKRGIVKLKNLKNKQKAIFLDRDGTINKYIGFLRRTEEFELIPGVAEAIRNINSSGYLAIVITNQPVIARGEVTERELDTIHCKMETELGREGAYLDGIYYCPHHPHKGYQGEIAELKIECDCRKPKPGLLLKAAETYNIDLNNSWMIGDSANDIAAGKNAGCLTALIGEGDYGQDMTVDSVLSFTERFLDNGK